VPGGGEAGKAVPAVSIESCQVTTAGTVTAVGSWSGIRAGSIVSATIVVLQQLDEGASRPFYRGYSYMVVNATTRTLGSFNSTAAGFFAWDGSAANLQNGFVNATIDVKFARTGLTTTSIPCTVV